MNLESTRLTRSVDARAFVASGMMAGHGERLDVWDAPTDTLSAESEGCGCGCGCGCACACATCSCAVASTTGLGTGSVET